MHFTDNFDGPAGSLPDPNVWRFHNGTHGPELQVYDSNHAKLDGLGNLVITAEKLAAPDPATGKLYVSSMIESAGKVEPLYGFISVRAKVPAGVGLWPAPLWLVGNDHDTPGSGWPICGEIDVVEVLGGDPLTAMGSLHGPLVSQPAPAKYDKSVASRMPARPGIYKADLSTDFHVYEVKWEPDRFTFIVDGIAAWPIFKSGLTADQRWVFDHPFWMILNLAVGDWAKTPTPETVFPAKLLIDWVKIRDLT